MSHISKDELQRTLLAIEAENKRRIYVNDPALWIHDRLGEHLWSGQRRILESVRDNRLTAVPTGHTVGKSFVASRCVAWWIATHPPGEAFVVTTASTLSQVRTVLWRELGRAHAKGQLPGRMNQLEWLMTMPAGNEETVAFGHKPADNDSTGFQGRHAKYMLVIFDEAAGVERALWEAGMTLVANEYSRFLAIGNPDDPVCEFAEVCKPGSGWNVIQISCLDTPSFTGEKVHPSVRESLIDKSAVEAMRLRWGESNPIYKARVLGQFPENTEDGLLSMEWIRAAQRRYAAKRDAGGDMLLTGDRPVEMGVDVGAGGDKTVFVIRHGAVARVLREHRNPDTMGTCGDILGYIRDLHIDKVKIDSIGIGKGVVDRAKEQNAPVVGVNVGESSDLEDMANLRAEGFWHLRTLFQTGQIDIDPNDNDLAAQLASLKYKRTSQGGRIIMESKDSMKRRGLPSPDRADALMLAFMPRSKKRVKATWGRHIKPSAGPFPRHGRTLVESDIRQA